MNNVIFVCISTRQSTTVVKAYWDWLMFSGTSSLDQLLGCFAFAVWGSFIIVLPVHLNAAAAVPNGAGLLQFLLMMCASTACAAWCQPLMAAAKHMTTACMHHLSSNIHLIA